ncbi:TetR/AcrR family transcriptional regulator [Deinococcus aquiradiocola]|uniref:TetR family transcriptional regulator n=1 Tax=Deinococcus aquiradiocola TaxID=393059 RepID=A0A917PBH1_9DEIO|nr:TetR/AcrR family transcriptional regulator [Deinococcus aquiradiocola]GGJ69832.1 TetR family transcriptional regulator [Deinococcus aquiradiocola]
MPVNEHRKRLAASARRQQILDAATALFIARGFEAVSMADLAQAIQVSRPAVYSYFPTTEAVLQTLLDERLQQLWTHLERLLPHNLDPHDRSSRGVYAALFGFLLGERESLLLLHSGGGPSFQARRTAFLTQLGERLEAQYPHIRRRPFQMVLITQLLDSLAHHAVQNDVQDVAALARTLDAFVRGGIEALSSEWERETEFSLTS